MVKGCKTVKVKAKVGRALHAKRFVIYCVTFHLVVE